MLEWFHNFAPSPVLWQWGALKIYWYGLIMVLAMASGSWLATRLSRDFGLNQNKLYDLIFWLIIWGLVGARLYHVTLEWGYYSQNPAEIIKVWHGGLAIHGAVIAGLVTVTIWSRRHKQNVWSVMGALTPGLAWGQALGRWGNYFNQELFGRPTDWPWGIWIDAWRRPLGYESFAYFQPTFLYESLASLLLAMGLVVLIKRSGHWKRELLGKLVCGLYLMVFGLYRGLIELIKIDPTPMIGSWRWPQVMSLILMVSGGIILYNALSKDWDSSYGKDII